MKEIFIKKCFETTDDHLKKGEDLPIGYGQDDGQHISIERLFKENPDEAGHFFAQIQNPEQLKKAVSKLKHPHAWEKAFDELLNKEKPELQDFQSMLILLQAIKKTKPKLLNHLNLDDFYSKVFKSYHSETSVESFKGLTNKINAFSIAGKKGYQVRKGEMHQISEFHGIDKPRIQREPISRKIKKPVNKISLEEFSDSSFIAKNKFEETLDNEKYRQIMKRYDGSLDQLNALSSAEFMQIAYQAMQGTYDLHQQNIVHAHIRPKNIFYLEKEDGKKIALGDLNGCIRVNEDGTPKSGSPALYASYAVDSFFLRPTDVKRLDFKYYDSYALFLSLIQLSFNQEDALTMKDIMGRLEKSFKNGDPTSFIEKILLERDEFVNEKLENTEDPNIKECLENLRDGKLTEALDHPSLLEIKQKFEEDERRKSEKSYFFLDQNEEPLPGILPVYMRSTQNVILGAKQIIEDLTTMNKPLSEISSSYQQWQEDIEKVLSKAKAQADNSGDYDFYYKMSALRRDMKEKFEKVEVFHKATNIFSTPERILDSSECKKIIENLKTQEEKTLNVFNYGTSVHKEDKGSIYLPFTKNDHSLVMRGVGSRPVLLDRELNFGVVFGKKGMEKRLKELMDFLKECDRKGSLPETINLAGYSRGAVSAIREAQAIYKVFGNRIKINLFLSDPVIGLVDGLTTKNLSLPENVQSAVITQACDDTDYFHRGIDVHQLDFNPEKTALTVIGLSGIHTEQNFRSRNGSNEAVLFNEWLLDEGLNQAGTPMPEISLKGSTNDGRHSALCSSLNKNLPVYLRNLHEKIRNQFYVQQNELDPEAFNTSPPALMQELNTLLNHEQLSFEDFQQTLDLIQKIKTTEPGYLPSNKVLFEKLDAIRIVKPFGDQHDKNVMNAYKLSTDLIKWYLELSDKRHPGNSGLMKRLSSVFKDFTNKDNDLLETLQSRRFQKKISNLFLEFEAYQMKKDPIKFYVEELTDQSALEEGKELARGTYNAVHVSYTPEKKRVLRKSLWDQPEEEKLVDSPITFYEGVDKEGKSFEIQKKADLPLNELIHEMREGRISISEENLWELSVQLIQQTTQLHQDGVVHYDIKPQNILVFFDQKNQKWKLQLTDFGSCLRIDPENGHLQKEFYEKSKTGSTLFYLSDDVLKTFGSRISNCQPNFRDNPELDSRKNDYHALHMSLVGLISKTNLVELKDVPSSYYAFLETKNFGNFIKDFPLEDQEVLSEVRKKILSAPNPQNVKTLTTKLEKKFYYLIERNATKKWLLENRGENIDKIVSDIKPDLKLFLDNIKDGDIKGALAKAESKLGPIKSIEKPKEYYFLNAYPDKQDLGILPVYTRTTQNVIVGAEVMREHFRTIADKIKNKEPIKNLDVFLSEYKQWMDSVGTVLSKKQNGEELKSVCKALKKFIKTEFNKLIKDPQLPNLLDPEKQLNTIDKNLQALKKGNYLEKSQNIKKINQKITSLLPSCAEKQREWFEDIVKKAETGKAPEKGIIFRGKNISIESLLKEGDSGEVKDFFNNLLNLHPNRFKQIFKNEGYLHNLELLNEVCLKKIEPLSEKNPLAETLSYESFVNSLSTLRILMKYAPESIQKDDMENYRKNISSFLREDGMQEEKLTTFMDKFFSGSDITRDSLIDKVIDVLKEEFKGSNKEDNRKKEVNFTLPFFNHPKTSSKDPESDDSDDSDGPKETNKF